MVDAKLRAVKRKIKALGLFSASKLVLKKLVDIILYRDNLLFYVDTQTYSVDYQTIGSGLTAREVTHFEDLVDDEITMIEDYAGEKYVTTLRKRLSDHWRLFLCHLDGQLAGAGWAISRKSGIKTKVIPLLDDSVALIDFWTLPVHRGNNVYSFLLSFIVSQLKLKGFSRAFISANERNIGSISGIKKAGYRYLINYEIYELFGHEIVVWKSK
jgi:hypothetical protein